jgi:hypothetical protein
VKPSASRISPEALDKLHGIWDIYHKEKYKKIGQACVSVGESYLKVHGVKNSLRIEGTGSESSPFKADNTYVLTRQVLSGTNELKEVEWKHKSGELGTVWLRVEDTAYGKKRARDSMVGDMTKALASDSGDNVAAKRLKQVRDKDSSSSIENVSKNVRHSLHHARPHALHQSHRDPAGAPFALQLPRTKAPGSAKLRRVPDSPRIVD